MIVKMSKIEVVGPKHLLEPVLELLQKNGVFQIEPEKIGFVDKPYEYKISKLKSEEKFFKERLYLENLRAMLEELNGYMPAIDTREVYLNPSTIIDTIAENLKKHLAFIRNVANKKNILEKNLQELMEIKSIFEVAKAADFSLFSETNFVWFILNDKNVLEELKVAITKEFNEPVEFFSSAIPGGKIVLIVRSTEETSDKLKQFIKKQDIPGYAFPEYLSKLTFEEKLSYVDTKIKEITVDLENINNELKKFAVRWLPIYNQTKKWIEERLSLIAAISSVFETKMCFIIYGWLPSKYVEQITTQVNETFKGEVVVEEKEVRVEDLEHVPVVLKNPPIFKPFELLVRFLPLPKYTNYDPTPFVAIFFPLFFGMILGDVGYGIVLAVFAYVLSKRYKSNQDIVDASKIILICSAYSCIFGILYGEFFGDLMAEHFNIKPLWIERRSSVLPVFYFAISVGVVHVFLGLVLGAIAAFKKHSQKEAIFKLLNILLILSILLIVISSSGILPFLIAKPIIFVVLILSPFLLFTGGLLAPLEVIKSIGNIISYARIMAIGLTSVLIAFVANKMAGMVGNIVLGIFVAVFLHLINIILGIFSPTIHSLRLHYVEFFSKFLEHGGKKYSPLK